MNLQFANIVDGFIHSYTSSDFSEVDEEILDQFYDWCGSEEADPEIFWCADVSQDADTIVVDFFPSNWPKDPQRVASIIAAKLGVTIAPFDTWFRSVDNV